MIIDYILNVAIFFFNSYGLLFIIFVIKWGVIIKGKSLFISLILLSIVLLSASVAFAATDDNATVSEVNNEISIDEDTLTANLDILAENY